MQPTVAMAISSETCRLQTVHLRPGTKSYRTRQLDDNYDSNITYSIVLFSLLFFLLVRLVYTPVVPCSFFPFSLGWTALGCGGILFLDVGGELASPSLILETLVHGARYAPMRRLLRIVHT